MGYYCCVTAVFMHVMSHRACIYAVTAYMIIAYCINDLSPYSHDGDIVVVLAHIAHISSSTA